jgi:hypothetical protein
LIKARLQERVGHFLHANELERDRRQLLLHAILVVCRQERAVASHLSARQDTHAKLTVDNLVVTEQKNRNEDAMSANVVAKPKRANSQSGLEIVLDLPERVLLRRNGGQRATGFGPVLVPSTTSNRGKKTTTRTGNISASSRQWHTAPWFLR